MPVSEWLSKGDTPDQIPNDSRISLLEVCTRATATSYNSRPSAHHLQDCCIALLRAAWKLEIEGVAGGTK